MPTASVTLVVHGTFAAKEAWWRLGENGARTFADRLEERLAARGMAGSVWRPALAAGMTCDEFAWSGRNRDGERRRAGRALARALDELARRAGATAAAPLTVHLVAHSHGGNVVLEALRHARGPLRFGAISLLGTPLITVRPAARFACLLLALLILLLPFALPFVIGFERGNSAGASASSTEAAANAPPREPWLMTVLTGFLVVILYGWLFWWLRWVIDGIWWVAFSLARAVASRFGRATDFVYGPSPARTLQILGGHPLLLLSAHHDEADVLLKIGSAPTELYAEWVGRFRSRWARSAEFLFLRPIVRGLVLPALEIVLEATSLGMPRWRTLFFDHAIERLEDRRGYPRSIVRHEPVDVASGSAAAGKHAGPVVVPAAVARVVTRSDAVIDTLREVARHVARQIRLCHSAYYEDDATIERIARHVVADETRPPAA